MLKFIFSSINLRLFFASALLLPAFLGCTGYYLDRAFYDTLVSAEQSRLKNHLYLLLSSADTPVKYYRKNETPKLALATPLADTDFERINSGLYAYLYDENRELIWRSKSASLQTAPSFVQIASKVKETPSEQTIFDFSHQDYFIGYSDIYWKISKNRESLFRFVVVHDAEEFYDQQFSYRNQLFRWLSTVAFLLLIIQIIIVRWGMRPVKQLTKALKAMQSGDTRNIEGVHTQELQEIVDNLNLVLEREHALRQRYRNSLSDLAHSLKTPLAVMQSKLNAMDPDLPHIAAEQIARMNQVVTYQLNRAMASQKKGNSQHTPLLPIVTRLMNALQKVYATKSVTTELQISEQDCFAGDDQDLMELLGNLLDNAFKYGKDKVKVVSQVMDKELHIWIEDNGTGVPDDKKAQIFERWQRLDTKIPGQGIGLSVVKEIIDGYKGQLNLHDSPLGGAQFEIILPAASLR